MSLAGSGVVAIWNGIEAHARAEFYEWHTREPVSYTHLTLPTILRV